MPLWQAAHDTLDATLDAAQTAALRAGLARLAASPAAQGPATV
jgi:hypothetical protein